MSPEQIYSKYQRSINSFLMVMMLLVAIGVVISASASGPFSFDRFGYWGALWDRRLLHLGIGLLVFLFAAHFPMIQLERYWALPFFLGTLGLLVLTLLLGTSAKGSARWLHIGVSIQTSELVKVSLVIYMAYYCSRVKWENFARISQALISFVPLLFVLPLLIGQPDLSTSLQISLVTGMILFIAGLRLHHLAIMLGSMGASAAVTIAFNPYQMQRIISFLDPWADPQGVTYQISRSLIAVGKGGFWGSGLGESTEKNLYLPEAYNDFIFAIFIEEMGFIGGLVLVLLFTLLLLWILRQGLQAIRNQLLFNGYVCFGVMCMIFTQQCMHMGVNLALLPPTGVNLPLISTGGTNLIITLYMLGLAVRVALENQEYALEESRIIQKTGYTI